MVFNVPLYETHKMNSYLGCEFLSVRMFYRLIRCRDLEILFSILTILDSRKNPAIQTVVLLFHP
jgi:hypothetical protein